MIHEDLLLAELQHEAEVEVETNGAESSASVEQAHDFALALCDELSALAQGMPYSDERSRVSDAWGQALEVLFNVGQLARH